MFWTLDHCLKLQHHYVLDLNFSLFSVGKERGRTYSWGSLERTIFHSLSSEFLPVPVAVGLRRSSTAARLLRLWVRIPPGTWMSVCYECFVLSGKRSVLRADHSSRGVLPTVMRLCVWSRNLKNEEAMARVGPQRHRGKKSNGFYEQGCPFLLSTWWRRYFQSLNRGGFNLTLIMPNIAVTTTAIQNSLSLN